MRRREFDDEDAEPARCTHEADRFGQALVGAHEIIEVVHLDGVAFVRRCGSTPCPDHLEAIRRARSFAENAARYARLKESR